MKKNLITQLLILAVLAVQAQTPIEVTLIKSFSRGKILAHFNTTCQNGVDLYKVLYTTPTPEGTIDTASGLLVIPNNADEVAYPFLGYQHATTFSRDAVPSNLEHDGIVAVLFASQGYIVTAADYLGLGDSKRLMHPYVHAKTEASAGIDLLKAAQSFMKESGLHYNDQLFLTGYSEGGHASMAMHRAINNNLTSEFTVTAGAHLSGPYSVSEEMKAIITENQVYDRPGFLVWMITGYQSVYGNLYQDLTDLLKPQFASIVAKFESGELVYTEMDEQVTAQLSLLNKKEIIPSLMIKEGVLAELRTNPDSPLNLALRDNDLFNWIPDAPTRLFYCKNDATVPSSNSIITAAMMKANGAPNVEAVNVATYLDHVSCIVPTTLRTLRFFNEFAERTLVHTEEVDNTNLTIAAPISANNDYASAFIKAYPNPVNATLKIQLNNRAEGLIRLTDLNGRVLQEVPAANLSSFEMNVQAYPAGLYVLQVPTDNGVWTEKVRIVR